MRRLNAALLALLLGLDPTPIPPSPAFRSSPAVVTSLSPVIRSPSSIPSDTVRLGPELSTILADPNQCRSAGSEGPRWREPQPVGQVGEAALGQSRFLSNGELAVIDLDQGRVRIFDAMGTENRQVGGRGAGPGEFSPGSFLVPWASDTVVVQDPAAGRLSLFLGRAFLSSISLGETQPPLVTLAAVGRLTDGDLLFYGGFAPGDGNTGAGPFRSQFKILRWRRGRPAPTVVRDPVPGPEFVPIGKLGFVSANFRRISMVGSLGDRFVVYDNARPELEIVDPVGRTIRRIILPLVDPVVTPVDRDTVTQRHQLQRARYRPPRAAVEATRRFPKTKPAALWQGTDYDGGIWLHIAPPASARDNLFVRILATGVIDRCLRVEPSLRAVAFGPDQVALVEEGTDGNVLTVRTAVRR